MKKLITVLVLAASLAVTSFAESPFSIGSRLMFSPNWMTGGKQTAQRDLDYAKANNFFTVSGVEAKNLGFGFTLDSYVEYDFTKNMALEVDFSVNWNQGYSSYFSKDGYDSMSWSRSYKTYEIAPMFKYLTQNGPLGFIGYCVGPNFVIAPGTTNYSIGSSSQEINAIQNKFNFGVIAGVDAGLAFSDSFLLTYTGFITFDFLRAYNEEACADAVVFNSKEGYYYSLPNLDAQFAKRAGNRFVPKFSLGITFRPSSSSSSSAVKGR